MDYLKGLNVIILSLLLILTGCFGLLSDDEEDSAEAQVPVENETGDSGSTTTTTTTTLTAQDIADAMILASNSPPELSVKKFNYAHEDYQQAGILASNWEYSGYFVCTEQSDFDEDPIGNTLEEQQNTLADELEEGASLHLANLIEVGDCIIYFDFLSVDPDGDSVTKGIDTNFDGIIDIPIVPNHGLTMVAIDNSTDRQIWNGMASSTCEQIDLAFIAVDEHGASTVEFVHFLGTQSCEDDDDDDGPNLMLYTFSGADANEDGAVLVTMDQGNQLPMAHVTIKAAVNGDASKTMVACSDTVTTDCYESPNPADPNYWSVGEVVIVRTADCSGTCEVVITILNSNEGVTLSTMSIMTE